MRNAIAVANQMLLAARERRLSLTPLKLIKLTYLAHAWMLALHGRALLGEPVEAWSYGPVIRSIYLRVKPYRDRPVSRLIRGRFLRAPNEDFDPQELEVIDQVLDVYGQRSAVALSELTHQPGSPWALARSRHGKTVTISNDMIEHHYKKLHAESGALRLRIVRATEPV